ncbi:uncharacterized protein LOC141754250 [Sebastes fasciatus]|uniref:uncharacterized protein LOC141754250 n=1 Tax=Sebastes fasciatus TaxID=394691 RepID=UPI003D9F0777
METTVKSVEDPDEDKVKGSQDGIETSTVFSHHRSRKSRSSRSSTSSSMSLEAARARAKAEAAKTRLAFTEKESELKIEKAKLEARIDYINQQREAEAAHAEAVVLETAAADMDGSDHIKDIKFLPLQESALKRTEDYVTHHALHQFPQAPKEEKDVHYPPPPALTPQQDYTAQSEVQSQIINRRPMYQQRETPQFHTDLLQQRSHSALPYKPSHSANTNQANTTTADLARLLAKNQLVSSGLTKFDDLPEHYQAWRETFINTIEYLELSASEEMDLLIKWLGKSTSEQALRIRSVNVRQPSLGLKTIWERLNKTYGSPEVIERALFSKIENFPKIQNRDNQTLQELADLLIELDVAKNDGYLPGLAYLDTARGVQPIVEKLPLYLQDKWMSQGCKYKREHGVAFPPFWYFKEFICREAEEKNYPSFNLPSLSTTSYKKEKFGQMKPVSVHKTSISSSDTASKIENPDRLCPMHNKPHSLKKCRGFRKMSFDDRKKFLKENNICFRCCASTVHQAKYCEIPIKCTECDSDRHLAALHRGPAPPSQPGFFPSSDNGGEREDTGQPDVTSRCTEVCGEDFKGKSCSKICLVNVYPNGHRKLQRKMYAILDEQSNVSLARSEFFDMFSIKGAAVPYTLKTCAGMMETAGRKAHGFTVESTDGKINMPLPILTECNEIPNNRSEIPTPEAAYHHHHLRQVASEIPNLDPAADILLLLGRDIIRAHKVRKQHNGPHYAPYAQKLDLGWVIIGDVCIGGVHKTNTVSAMKTCILDNGRPTCLTPCENQIRVKEIYSIEGNSKNPLLHKPTQSASLVSNKDNLGKMVFCTTENDNLLAHSIEDLTFLQIMEREIFQDDTNRWVAPLPFRHPRRCLPNIRGHTKHLRSDCGTNFIGAFKELKMDSKCLSDSSVEDYLLQQKCTWVFNPPHSSHMGGAWERMIGVARRILDAMLLQVGPLKLTHEVLITFMAEVSAIVNARPLIPVSTDPEAPLILTPAMLLTQKTGTSLCPVSEFSKRDLLKNQWKRVQALAETFWARWRQEYLSTLQSRQKWQSQKPNLKEGDIVLMKDSQTKRNQWPMGIIVKVIPSKDGLVRKVEVKVTRNQTVKIFSRPISEVVLLFSQEDKETSTGSPDSPASSA